MAHDFAKGKKRPRKSPTTARRKPTRKTAKKNDVSGRPTWFGAGLLCGLFLAFLGSMALQSNNGKPASSTKKIKTATKPEVSKPAETKPRFEFYDMLPESEVEINTSSLPAATVQQYTYIMQAGSFTTAEDADRRRAEILLMGMQAKIEKADNGERSTRYRVYVGPFQDRASANRARAQLSNNTIETLLLKRKRD